MVYVKICRAHEVAFFVFDTLLAVDSVIPYRETSTSAAELTAEGCKVSFKKSFTYHIADEITWKKYEVRYYSSLNCRNTKELGGWCSVVEFIGSEEIW